MLKALQSTFKTAHCYSNLQLTSVRMLTSARKPIVFITQPIPDQALEILSSKELDLVINKQLPLTRAKLIDSLRECDALFCTLNEKIDKEVLDVAENLKVAYFCLI
jgi:phosphoglycerate dehydrogenase-like enzyme